MKYLFASILLFVVLSGIYLFLVNIPSSFSTNFEGKQLWLNSNNTNVISTSLYERLEKQELGNVTVFNDGPNLAEVKYVDSNRNFQPLVIPNSIKGNNIFSVKLVNDKPVVSLVRSIDVVTYLTRWVPNSTFEIVKPPFSSQYNTFRVYMYEPNN